ncbi:MAG: hypothetical protein L6R30_03295 [Thermoanaerobaculia bacterium]|nr:hypothetical protein [Thermoanaerobaculia bacterium]
MNAIGTVDKPEVSEVPLRPAPPGAIPPRQAPQESLQETWQRAKEKAREVRREATKSWEDLAEGFDRGVKERPLPVALGVLGAGIALGLLAGVTLALAVRKR